MHKMLQWYSGCDVSGALGETNGLPPTPERIKHAECVRNGIDCVRACVRLCESYCIRVRTAEQIEADLLLAGAHTQCTELHYVAGELGTHALGDIHTFTYFPMTFSLVFIFDSFADAIAVPSFFHLLFPPLGFFVVPFDLNQIFRRHAVAAILKCVRRFVIECCLKMVPTRSVRNFNITHTFSLFLWAWRHIAFYFMLFEKCIFICFDSFYGVRYQCVHHTASVSLNGHEIRIECMYECAMSTYYIYCHERSQLHTHTQSKYHSIYINI